MKQNNKTNLIFGMALAMLAAGVLSCSQILDDPLNVRDPADTLDIQTNQPDDTVKSIQRKNIVESFGHFSCPSCPEAETKLIPYIHHDTSLGIPHVESFVVINYHADFSGPDPWVDPEVVAYAEIYGYNNTLPQIKLNGSNARYGVPEKGFKVDEYESLLSNQDNYDQNTPLQITLDTSSLSYDTAANSAAFNFSAANLSDTALSQLTFYITAAKNKPVFGIITGEFLWEVIVVKLLQTDKDGRTLSVASLDSKASTGFSVLLTVPDEAKKHIKPHPDYGPEKISDYSIIIFCKDESGFILNTLAHNYNPVSHE